MKKIFTIISLVVSISLFGQNAAFYWATMGGNPSINDTRSAIEALPGGGYLMAGEFDDLANFDNITLETNGGTDFYFGKFSDVGVSEWVKQGGGTDNDYVVAMTTDSYENIYLAGYFYGKMQIEDVFVTAAGAQDVYLAKFDNEGNLIWLRSLGGIMADYISGLAISADNEPIITGYFYGEISIAGQVLSSSTGSDVYTAKYSGSGDLLWAEQFSGISSDQASSVSCDGLGNIFVSGSFYNQITIGGNELTTSYPVGVYYAKLDGDGEILWAKQVDGTNLNIRSALACDNSNNIYLGGNFNEIVTLGTYIFDAGYFNLDAFLARLDQDGNIIWAKHAASPADNDLIAIDTDSEGNVYILGHFLIDVQFDDVTLIYTLCCGSREISVVSYTGAGKVLWGKQISGARANAQAFSMSDESQLYISGFFKEDVLFDQIKISSYESFKNFMTHLETDAVVYIKDDLNNQEITIYPNPVKDFISVKTTANISEYCLYTSSGTIITSGFLKEKKIPVRKLSPGIYFIELTTEKDAVIVPIIKTR